MSVTARRCVGRLGAVLSLLVLVAGLMAASGAVASAQTAQAQTTERAAGGEANLILPDLSSVDFHGVNGRTLLMFGLIVCAAGLLFGLLTFTQLMAMPVPAS